jgi:hypothetical protein
MADQPTLLASFLADHDVPCPGCEYNLRGLAEQRCPECGASIELDVRRESTAAAAASRRWGMATFAWPGAFLLVQGITLSGGWAPKSPGLVQMIAWIWSLWVWFAGSIGVAALIIVAVRPRACRSRQSQRHWLTIHWTLVTSFVFMGLLHAVAMLM